MVAGYGGVYTGDANVDAFSPTHTFRAPTTGEFGWDSSKVLFTANRILTNQYDLGVLRNGLYSFPRAMNQAGEIVGYSDYGSIQAGVVMFSPTNFHAVFWALTNEAPDDLHSLQQLNTNKPPTGFSDAYAINDQSQIVGTSWRNYYTALRTILINAPDNNGGVQTQAVSGADQCVCAAAGRRRCCGPTRYRWRRSGSATTIQTGSHLGNHGFERPADRSELAGIQCGRHQQRRPDSRPTPRKRRAKITQCC